MNIRRFSKAIFAVIFLINLFSFLEVGVFNLRLLATESIEADLENPEFDSPDYEEMEELAKKDDLSDDEKRELNSYRSERRTFHERMIKEDASWKEELSQLSNYFLKRSIGPVDRDLHFQAFLEKLPDSTVEERIENLRELAKSLIDSSVEKNEKDLMISKLGRKVYDVISSREDFNFPRRLQELKSFFETKTSSYFFFPQNLFTSENKEFLSKDFQDEVSVNFTIQSSKIAQVEGKKFEDYTAGFLAVAKMAKDAFDSKIISKETFKKIIRDPSLNTDIYSFFAQKVGEHSLDMEEVKEGLFFATEIQKIMSDGKNFVESIVNFQKNLQNFLPDEDFPDEDFDDSKKKILESFRENFSSTLKKNLKVQNVPDKDFAKNLVKQFITDYKRLFNSFGFQNEPGYMQKLFEELDSVIETRLKQNVPGESRVRNSVELIEFSKQLENVFKSVKEKEEDSEIFYKIEAKIFEKILSAIEFEIALPEIELKKYTKNLSRESEILNSFIKRMGSFPEVKRSYFAGEFNDLYENMQSRYSDAEERLGRIEKFSEAFKEELTLSVFETPTLPMDSLSLFCREHGMLPEDFLEYFEIRLKKLTDEGVESSNVSDYIKNLTELVELEKKLSKKYGEEGNTVEFQKLLPEKISKEFESRKEALIKGILDYSKEASQFTEGESVVPEESKIKLYGELNTLITKLSEAEGLSAKVSGNLNEILRKIENYEKSSLSTLSEDIFNLPMDADLDKINNFRQKLEVFLRESVLDAKEFVDPIRAAAGYLDALEALQGGRKVIRSSDLKRSKNVYEALTSDFDNAWNRIIDSLDYRDYDSFDLRIEVMEKQKDTLEELLDSLKKNPDYTEALGIIEKLRKIDRGELEYSLVDQRTLLTLVTGLKGSFELTSDGRALLQKFESFESRLRELEKFLGDFKGREAPEKYLQGSEGIPVENFSKDLKLGWMIPEDQIDLLNKLAVKAEGRSGLSRILEDRSTHETFAEIRKQTGADLKELGEEKSDFESISWLLKQLDPNQELIKKGIIDKENYEQKIYTEANKLDFTKILAFSEFLAKKMGRGIELVFEELKNSMLSGKTEDMEQRVNENLRSELQELFLYRKFLETGRFKTAEAIDIGQINRIGTVLAFMRGENIKKYRQKYEDLVKNLEIKLAERKALKRSETEAIEGIDKKIAEIESEMRVLEMEQTFSVDPALEARTDYILKEGKLPSARKDWAYIEGLLSKSNPEIYIGKIGRRNVLLDSLSLIEYGSKKFGRWIREKSVKIGRKLKKLGKATAVVGAGAGAGLGSYFAVSKIPFARKYSYEVAAVAATATSLLTYVKISGGWKQTAKSWVDWGLDQVKKIMPESVLEASSTEEVGKYVDKLIGEIQDKFSESEEISPEQLQEMINKIEKESKGMAKKFWRDVSLLYKKETETIENLKEDLKEKEKAYLKVLSKLSKVKLSESPSEFEIESALRIMTAKVRPWALREFKRVNSELAEVQEKIGSHGISAAVTLNLSAEKALQPGLFARSKEFVSSTFKAVVPNWASDSVSNFFSWVGLGAEESVEESVKEMEAEQILKAGQEFIFEQNFLLKSFIGNVFEQSGATENLKVSKNLEMLFEPWRRAMYQGSHNLIEYYLEFLSELKEAVAGPAVEAT